MRIDTDGNEVVCSLENKNSAFLSDCTGMFDGFYFGKLRLNQDNPEEWCDPDAAVLENVRCLDKVLFYARQHGIEVSESVFEKQREMQAVKEKIIARRKALKEEKELQKNWERLCKNGCGNCQHKRRWNDDYLCAASGDLLEKNNRPMTINGIYHIVNFVPFPSENCPYNTNKTKGDIKNECLSKASACAAKA